MSAPYGAGPPDGPVPGAPVPAPATGAPVPAPPTGAPVPGSGSGAEPTWRRVHRVTPLLTAWKFAVALVAVILFQSFDDILRLPLSGLAIAGILAGVVVLAVIVSLIYSYLAWRRTTYAVTADAVVLRSGVLFRRERVARLPRIQAVEITQPILGRLFGFSALKVESAGGAEANLNLAYLTQAEAQAVRNEVLARAAGLDVDSPLEGAVAGAVDGAVEAGTAAGAAPSAQVDAAVTADGVAGVAAEARPPGRSPLLVPEAPEHEVFRLPVKRQVLSLLLHGGTISLALGVVVFVTLAIVLDSTEFVFGPLAGVLGVVAFLWSRFAGEFNFRVATSPDGLRVRKGLLETKAQTIPPGRIQSVQLHQGPLWRMAGWWRVQVSLAQAASSDGTETADALLPVGSAQEALALVRLAVPGIAEDELAALEAGLRGSGDAEGWVPAPRRSRWLDPISYRRNAFQVLRAALAMRRGRVFRLLTIVPHERTQSLGISRGPLERRLTLVSFHAHSSGSHATSLPHLDPAVAARLLAEQSERARTARRGEGPELWMRTS